MAKISVVCSHLAVSIPYPPLVNILNTACPALGGVQSFTQGAVSLDEGGSMVSAARGGIGITPPKVGGEQGGILGNTNQVHISERIK